MGHTREGKSAVHIAYSLYLGLLLCSAHMLRMARIRELRSILLLFFRVGAYCVITVQSAVWN